MRRISVGGRAVIQADEDVVASEWLREFEGRSRDLERLLGVKTLKVDILQEAFSVSGEKTCLAVASVTSG